MLPIDRYLSGWLNGFLAGTILVGLIFIIVFLIYEMKARRSHIAPMRDQRWLDR